jgi:antitoxin VapB
VICFFGTSRRGIIVETAKIFWSGRSQAVRVPKQFRFDTSEVRIRRRGDAVILEPVAHDWAWLDKVIGLVDVDFVQAATEPSQQDRTALEYFE